jgi:hypothetical protein
MPRGLLRFLRNNTIALLALFIALSGTTYAAATALAPNSVGTKQLKKNAVTAAKIRKSAVTNAKIANKAVTGAKVKDDSLTGADVLESSLGKVPSATAADTATNATNASHATTADSATTAASTSSLGTLASGKTETGTFYIIAPQNAGANFIGVEISFPMPLAANPSPHYITSGTTTQCPGSAANPTAASGQLCLYQLNRSGAGTPGFEDVSKYGAGVFNTTTSGTGYEFITGRWAVTG